MASIELRTPKNKPAYYKITASITLNGQAGQFSTTHTRIQQG